jgi:hypothetical protein
LASSTARTAEASFSRNTPLGPADTENLNRKETEMTIWATIKSMKAGDDLIGARDLVTAVQSRPEADGPPDLRGLRNTEAAIRDSYSTEVVSGEVRPGMIRGGQFGAAGGFGWRTKDDMLEWNARQDPHRKHAIGAPQRNRRRTPAPPTAA